MPKKVTSENINNKLSLVMKSGKANLGFKQTLKGLRNGHVKMVILSQNCPEIRKALLEYYVRLAKAEIYHFSGNNAELGAACGRYHRVSTMGIIDPGDSDIFTA